MVINRSETTQERRNTQIIARLADFYFNPLPSGYRNNCFFLPYKSLYFERYATVLMVIFRAWATCDDSCGMCVDRTVRLDEKHELALLGSCSNIIDCYVELH